MFANTQIPAMQFGFPDVCNTIVGTATTPLPYPNLAYSSSHVPSNYKQYFTAGSAHNLLTAGTLSSGDETGTATGVASATIVASDTYLVGSVKVFNGEALAARFGNINIQNSTNAPGVTILPSVNRVCLFG